MKKSLALTMLTLLALSTTGAAIADDNKVVCGCKKVGNAVVWPFKKLGQGMKAVGKKITGK